MTRLLGSAALLLALASLAPAHFVFIVPPTKDGQKVSAVFSDSTTPDDAKYLKKIAHTKFYGVDDKGEATEVTAKPKDDVLQIEKIGKGATAVVGATAYGVLEKKGETFLLNYYSRAGLTAKGRAQELPAKVAPLQVVVTGFGASVTVKVLWQGKPLAGSEVVLAGVENAEAVETDKNGEAKLKLPKDVGEVIAVRAKHVEKKAGEHDGKKYDSVRSYATTTFVKP